jgi:hypothetical protein
MKRSVENRKNISTADERSPAARGCPQSAAARRPKAHRSDYSRGLFFLKRRMARSEFVDGERPPSARIKLRIGKKFFPSLNASCRPPLDARNRTLDARACALFPRRSKFFPAKYPPGLIFWRPILIDVRKQIVRRKCARVNWGCALDPCGPSIPHATHIVNI